LIVEPVEAAGAANAPAESKEARPKGMVGRVSSNKMQKTVVVEVEKHKMHRLYHKKMRVVKSYMAHDEEETCKIGDTVRIADTRPLSKNKRWRVVEILGRADSLGGA
jgi:small subunit ribosomal protein S17